MTAVIFRTIFLSEDYLFFYHLNIFSENVHCIDQSN